MQKSNYSLSYLRASVAAAKARTNCSIAAATLAAAAVAEEKAALSAITTAADIPAVEAAAVADTLVVAAVTQAVVDTLAVAAALAIPAPAHNGINLNPVLAGNKTRLNNSNNNLLTGSKIKGNHNPLAGTKISL